ncbi:transcriptional regulator with XRE-family HTH domain [Metabacillus malikii]|uniref:Transcriptional regulator with XRE-family HTH domain n=1 Tax=Metabacillus malikii TaxID=1504265 RepID=A0ABT9ZEK7_9BACI|nr:transcriptional regulator with XRE-family HTH domain [Metabacillus malikii]
MAEKMSVSRSAVAKWESNKGMPDIENLKSMALLFNVSIDYLLSDESTIDFSEMKEPIALDDFEVTGKCRSKEDAVVLAKYPNATGIYPLIRSKKLNKTENVLDFLFQPGIFQIANYAADNSAYYLVVNNNKQYLVNVTKEFIKSIELAKKITDKKFVVGDNKFKKAAYKIVG